ncbi:hypothetical protein SRHO_G00060490 [Serrasalmus rhombeus]
MCARYVGLYSQNKHTQTHYRPKAVHPLADLTHFPPRRDNPAAIMHKLITITVLIAVLALGVESFLVPVKVEDMHEEKGTVATVIDTLKSYYDQGLNTASGYIENIKELKLEEKAKTLLDETSQAVRTYFGIFQDQLYHIVYTQESH